MATESSSKAILSLACKRKEELVVRIEGSGRIYRSSFLCIPEQLEGHFCIDNLPQGAARKYLTANKSILSARFDMHDVRYSFKATYAGMVKYNKFDALKVKIPDKIKAIQRREHFRVEPKISNPIKIKLPDGEESTAIDVSTGGASFWCKHSYPVGTVINVSINLPGEAETLKLDFEVIASDKTKESYATRKRKVGLFKIRGKFPNPSQKEIQLIQHFGHARQREVIRITT
ncbi:hypothetical protein MNBD_NITROSPINAE01-126 [hydrothermal vent metagenome]|uniref:PilZ domain-containing protein n=1 Tax=hydrothermal vent metagenome TaxID=652676 RepID=A0A3B1CHR5_9ZZZZ